jgi:hypothetical protein
MTTWTKPCRDARHGGRCDEDLRRITQRQAPKRRRGDTDDRRLLAVDPNGFTNSRQVPAKFAAPQPFADDGGERRAGQVIARNQEASGDGLNAHHAEVPAGDAERLDRGGVVRTAERDIESGPSGDG